MGIFKSIKEFFSNRDGLDESKLEDHLLKIRLRYKDEGLLLNKNELEEVYRSENNWECSWNNNFTEIEKQQIYSYITLLKKTGNSWSLRGKMCSLDIILPINMFFLKKTRECGLLMSK